MKDNRAGLFISQILNRNAFSDMPFTPGITRGASPVAVQSTDSNSHRDEMLDLDSVERYGPCGVMLKKCGNDAKVLFVPSM